MDPIIYKIKKASDTGKLSIEKMEVTINNNVSDSVLTSFINYSTNMSAAYSSCIMEDKTIRSVPYFRRKAYSFNEAVEKASKEKGVIAYSHRYGGWTGFKWNFGKDILFKIDTNFGFGSVSYLHSTLLYKDVVLAPLSYYVKYKNSTYASIYRCTYGYKVDYWQWKNLMEDCIKMYNSIVDEDADELLKWQERELEEMVSGLEQLATENTVSMSTNYFQNEWDMKSSMASITGDDLWIIRAEKIGNCLKFINNIMALPISVDKEKYVIRLKCLCKTFTPKLRDKIDNVNQELESKQGILENVMTSGDYPLYQRLKDRHYYKEHWNISSNKKNMLRYLLKLLHRMGYMYDRTSIHLRIDNLKRQKDYVDTLCRDCNRLRVLQDKLQGNYDTMVELIEEQ